MSRGEELESGIRLFFTWAGKLNTTDRDGYRMRTMTLVNIEVFLDRNGDKVGKVESHSTP